MAIAKKDIAANNPFIFLKVIMKNNIIIIKTIAAKTAKELSVNWFKLEISRFVIRISSIFFIYILSLKFFLISSIKRLTFVLNLGLSFGIYSKHSIVSLLRFSKLISSVVVVC